MDEVPETLGFLTDEGILYCSSACASRDGKRHGREVDQEIYDALRDGSVLPGGSLCPSCLAEFPVDWEDSAPN